MITAARADDGAHFADRTAHSACDPDGGDENGDQHRTIDPV
jgi:hypothetical protein